MQRVCQLLWSIWSGKGESLGDVISYGYDVIVLDRRMVWVVLVECTGGSDEDADDHHRQPERKHGDGQESAASHSWSSMSIVIQFLRAVRTFEWSLVPPSQVSCCSKITVALPLT